MADFENMLTQEQIKKRQGIAGSAFLLAVSADVIVRILKAAGVIDELMSWYIIPVAMMSVFGFGILYSLASNSIAEIFALCQGVIVAFFSLLATFVIYSENNRRDDVYTPILLVSCIGFVLLSMYMHTVLLSSGNFKPSSLRWIALVPLSYLGDVCRYLCWLQNYADDPPYLSNWSVDNPLSVYVAWFVLMISAIGCWRLCHSEPFSAQNDDFSMPRWSPLNRFFVGYAAAVVTIFWLF